MQFRILNQRPHRRLSFSSTTASITTESGAMISMTSGFHLETTTHTRGGGGLFKGVKRLLSGESFFVSQFDAHQDNQTVVLAPALAGDIVHHRLDFGNLVVQGSSWLASTEGIDIDLSFQGIGKALFSSEGVLDKVFRTRGHFSQQFRCYLRDRSRRWVCRGYRSYRRVRRLTGV